MIEVTTAPAMSTPAFADGRPSLEFARSMELLARLLLGPPAWVLDVAGAPGTYAAPLARRGYRVHVVDPVPLHVEHARQVRIHFAARPACQRRTSMRAINALNAEMVVLSGRGD